MDSSSYSTPMTNPYSQKPLSVENLLSNLTRARGSPALAIIQSIRKQMLQMQTDWSLAMALDLSSVVLRAPCLSESHDASISEERAATLRLLVHTLPQWSDDMLYAVLLHDRNSQSNSKNLLNFLINQSKREHPLQLAALAGIATASMALDRLQNLTNLDPNVPDSAWWFTEEDSRHLAILSFKTLTRVEDGFYCTGVLSDMSFPTPAQIKIGSISILTHLLKHEAGYFREYFDDEGLRMMCSRLLADVQCLVQTELYQSATPETLSIALLSTTLLTFMQYKLGLDLHDFDCLIQRTALVENIVKFTFPASQHGGFSDGPQWTCDGQFAVCQSRALELIQCWSICNNDAWSLFQQQERHWSTFVETSWTKILLNQHEDVARSILPKLFLLHASCRIPVRNILAMTVQKMQTEHDSISSLYCCLVSRLSTTSIHPSHIVRTLSARLLWILLSDRKSISTHDNISRELWSAVDADLVERCLAATIDLGSTEDIQQPYLLVLLDLLNLFCETWEYCDHVLSRLGASGVEKLVYMVRPREVKFDFRTMINDDNESGGDESTPPANNLSRLDETSICVEHEEEMEPRGFDNSIRLAAATVLSRLGYHSSPSPSQSIDLLVSRVRTAVNEFLASLHEPVNNKAEHDPLGRNQYNRSFRLLVNIATQENEDFVATLLFAKHVRQNHLVQQLEQENESKQLQILEGLRREGILEEEKQIYLRQSRSDSTILKRELAKLKCSATQDARQLVAIHVSERSNAESRASKLHEQVEQSKEKLQQAKLQLEESILVEGRSKEELSSVQSTVRQLENKTEDLAHLLQAKVLQSKESEEKLKVASDEIVSLRGRNNELEAEVGFCEDENRSLKKNLEDLFADMVSMAQIYEFQEKERHSCSEASKRKVEDLGGKLNAEREKNRVMAESLNSLGVENDKLLRKVERYRERLEHERREREDEKQRRKRSGPVSYINQLHDSQRSSLNQSTYNRSSKASTSRLGKENSYYASSSSQRRKDS